MYNRDQMSRARVLLADSDDIFRASAQRALARLDYHVVTSANGADALACAQREPFDVVVVEIGMPQVDGLQVLRVIKAQMAWVPVILLTDAHTLGSAAVGIRAGAFDYLVKPLEDLGGLGQTLERALAAHPRPVRPAILLAPAPDAESAESTTVTEPAPPAQAPADLTIQTATTSPLETDLRPALSPIVESLTAARPLTETLNAAAEALARFLGAEHTLILLAHADSQLHLAAAFGYSDRTAAQQDVERIGEDLPWQAVLQREWVWGVEPGDIGARAARVALPLIFGNRVLGVALAHPVRPREQYLPASLDSAALICAQAAAASELERLQSQVVALQPNDDLTGLLNREHFLAQADREFRRSWRYNQPLAALVLDLDSFAKLNQLIAPEGGDQVLQQVAGTLRSSIRSVDLIGRLGEDNFAIMLMMANGEQAGLVAERLRRALGQIQLPTPDGVWQLTASFGGASYPRENCASLHDLLTLAEQALRAAKRAGRNRIRIV